MQLAWNISLSSNEISSLSPNACLLTLPALAFLFPSALLRSSKHKLANGIHECCPWCWEGANTSWVWTQPLNVFIMLMSTECFYPPCCRRNTLEVLPGNNLVLQEEGMGWNTQHRMFRNHLELSAAALGGGKDTGASFALPVLWDYKSIPAIITLWFTAVPPLSPGRHKRAVHHLNPRISLSQPATGMAAVSSLR